MGLDMYLYAEKYVSGYSFEKDTPEFDAIVEAMGIDAAEGSPHAMIDLCVMYWRKSNAIHSWFVDKVQNGVDECQRSYVSKDQLRALIDACENDELTPRAGFFFGSVDKDSWYYEDLTRTADTLRAILANPQIDSYSFYYHSSW